MRNVAEGDIRLLALYFLTRENQRYGRNLVLSARALDRLEGYQWPGNIRQLENVIERAVIMVEKDLIYAEDIEQILEEEPVDAMGREPRGRDAVAAGAIPYSGPGRDLSSSAGRPYLRVRDSERMQIEAALQSARGNKTLAANFLGLTPRQLHYRLEKLGLRSRG